MAIANTPNVILPSWRQGRLLFFTSVIDPYTTRLDYRVAAATRPNDTVVFRTHKAPITGEGLAKCQETADNGMALQQFFHMLCRGNLDDLTEISAQNLPPCASGPSPLIYTCSYFNFLRKYSVDQALVKHYEAQTPEERFDREGSLSIYKILSAHLQPKRAATLIDADIPDINRVIGAPKVVANLLREVAIIRHDTGKPAAAIKAMQRAAKLHNTEDKWRRLADFAVADQDKDQAIAFYFEAEKLAPLASPQALRMAGLLVDTGQKAEAEAFLQRAEPAFAAQVGKLRAKLEAPAAPE